MLSPNETSPTENSTSQSTMTSANFERDMEGNTGSALLEESNNNDEESTNNENAEDDKLYSDLTVDQMDITQALIDRAKEGDGAAIYYIGSLYHHCQNYTKAWEWLQLAAEKNNSGALHMMGLMCENGNGVKVDILESLSWYLKAVKLGDLNSCLCIASLFEKGDEMAKDYQRAADWYIQGRGEIPEDKNYTNITPSEEQIEQVIIATMQFLEEEREKRWKNKIHELEVENQKLSEEVLQARNVINDMCDSQYLESTLRRDRRIIYSSYED